MRSPNCRVCCSEIKKRSLSYDRSTFSVEPLPLTSSFHWFPFRNFVYALQSDAINYYFIAGFGLACSLSSFQFHIAYFASSQYQMTFRPFVDWLVSLFAICNNYFPAIADSASFHYAASSNYTRSVEYVKRNHSKKSPQVHCQEGGALRILYYLLLCCQNLLTL